MKVSIITVAYNSEKFISETIESVLNQTYPDVEYIIVDGASTDSTMAIVHQYMSYKLKVVTEPDAGMYDALNKGIKLATGDLIMCLNSDDRLACSNTIQEVVSYVAASSDYAGIFVGDIFFEYPDKTLSRRRIFTSNIYELITSGNCVYIPQPALFIRKELIQRVGCFNLQFKYAADYDYIIRLREFSVVQAIGIVTTIFRRHDLSITEKCFINMVSESKVISDIYLKKYSISKLSFLFWYMLGRFKYLIRNPVVIKNRLKKYAQKNITYRT